MPLLICILLSTCLLAADGWAASFAKETAGDYPGALLALQLVKPEQRDPYLVALRSGWLRYRAGRHEDAIADYQEACRLAPGAIEPRLGMIPAQLAAKRWSDAERTARQVLRGSPGHFWASYWLAEALLGGERAREANEVSRGLCDLYPGDATVLEQAVRVRRAAGDGGADASARLAILKLAGAR